MFAERKILTLAALLFAFAPSHAFANPDQFELGPKNAVTILPSNGSQNLQELLDLIASANKDDKLRISTYVFTDDVVGRAIMHALSTAAERGADIHVIIDPSYYNLPDIYMHQLQRSGVKVKEFHPMGGDGMLGRAWKTVTHGPRWMNNRSHDKMAVLQRAKPDGKTEYLAFMGSSNLVDAHFQLDPTMLYEKEPALLRKAIVVLATVRDRVGRYISGGGNDPKVIDRMIDESVAAEAKGNMGFFEEVRLRLKALRLKYNDLGYQYLDVNYILRGESVRELIDYHDAVWESRHVQERTFNEAHYDSTKLGRRNAARAGLPIELDLGSEKVLLQYDPVLLTKLTNTWNGQPIELGGQEIVLTQKHKDILRKLQPVVTIPGKGDLVFSLDQILEINSAPVGKVIKVEGIEIEITRELKAQFQKQRYVFQLPSGSIARITVDDMEKIRKSPLNKTFKIGTYKTEMTDALREQVMSVDPDKLAKDWIKKAFDTIHDAGYVGQSRTRDVFRSRMHHVGRVQTYFDSMVGNVPQGSEQGPLDVFRQARAGDEVAINGRNVQYTADLFRDLEKAAVGDVLEIAGEKVTLTKEILETFAKATPADEIHLLNQYGMLTPEIAAEMTAASRRGVKINLVLNGPRSMWDSFIPVRGYELTFQQLMETGARVVEYPLANKQIHAKIYTLTNPMGEYISQADELRYPANPGSRRVRDLGDGRVRFRDILREEMAVKNYIDLRHSRGFTVTGTSNIDARSLTIMKKSDATWNIVQRIKDWATGLRNSEINLGLESFSLAQEMKLKVQELEAGGLVVTDRAKPRPGVIRSCPRLYKVLGPLI